MAVRPSLWRRPNPQAVALSEHCSLVKNDSGNDCWESQRSGINRQPSDTRRVITGSTKANAREEATGMCTHEEPGVMVMACGERSER
jgi:hypothetical protein